MTFLYISHHLEEIYEVCRSVTVMRDGQVVAEAPLGEMPKERVVAAMVGDVGARGRPSAAAGTDAAARSAQRPASRSDGLAHRRRGRATSRFAIAAGECVGLAGLAGSGKERVARRHRRPDRARPAATITVDGTALPLGEVAETARAGRRLRAARPPRAAASSRSSRSAENMTLTIVDRLGSAGFISPAERDREAARTDRDRCRS